MFYTSLACCYFEQEQTNMYKKRYFVVFPSHSPCFWKLWHSVIINGGTAVSLLPPFWYPTTANGARCAIWSLSQHDQLMKTNCNDWWKQGFNVTREWKDEEQHANVVCKETFNWLVTVWIFKDVEKKDNFDTSVSLKYCAPREMRPLAAAPQAPVILQWRPQELSGCFMSGSHQLTTFCFCFPVGGERRQRQCRQWLLGEGVTVRNLACLEQRKPSNYQLGLRKMWEKVFLCSYHIHKITRVLFGRGERVHSLVVGFTLW